MLLYVYRNFISRDTITQIGVLAADAPAESADTGADQDGDSYPRQYQPQPDVGTTLTNTNTKSSYDPVTVGHVLDTVVIQPADLAPDGSNEDCSSFFSFLNSSIDVILNGEQVSGDSSSRNQPS